MKTIPREKLEALAGVMGGKLRKATPMYQDAARCGELGIVYADGTYAPGTLESLYAKLDKWVDADGENREVTMHRLGDGDCQVKLFDPVMTYFSGTELECLVDAVLWAFGEEGIQH